VIGAAVGCLIGRHEAKKREREERARRERDLDRTSRYH
jgi:hypothetical protein